MPSISALFSSLGAPLVNQRWPWGAQRRKDGAVFLRVWQDLKFMQTATPFSWSIRDGKTISTVVDTRSECVTSTPFDMVLRAFS